MAQPTSQQEAVQAILKEGWQTWHIVRAWHCAETWGDSCSTNMCIIWTSANNISTRHHIINTWQNARVLHSTHECGTRFVLGTHQVWVTTSKKTISEWDCGTVQPCNGTLSHMEHCHIRYCQDKLREPRWWYSSSMQVCMCTRVYTCVLCVCGIACVYVHEHVNRLYSHVLIMTGISTHRIIHSVHTCYHNKTKPCFSTQHTQVMSPWRAIRETPFLVDHYSHNGTKTCQTNSLWRCTSVSCFDLHASTSPTLSY